MTPTATADIELQTGSEFCVSGCYALTPAGEEFIDAYVDPPHPAALTVVDSGRIVLPDDRVARFRQKAKDAGLVIAETKASV